jgi:hypothetical protein
MGHLIEIEFCRVLIYNKEIISREKSVVRMEAMYSQNHNLMLICKYDTYPNHMMFPSHTWKLEYFTPVEIIIRGSH